MKKLPATTVLLILALIHTAAAIGNPVLDYKSKYNLVASDKLLKWQSDLDGNGKQDVFLILKESYEELRDQSVPGWEVYMASQGGIYTKIAGVEDESGVGPALPQIDPEACFVGQITQLGKRGIVTFKIDNPREGESKATIYTYTIEGNHLKYTELAQYTPGQPNAIFDQYLKDNVRTQVQLQEVTP
jgi:hypothetical protein